MSTEIFGCPQCDYKSKFHQLLKRHIEKHHGMGGLESYLAERKRKKYSIEKSNYSCPHCYYVAEYKSSLDRHLLLHSSVDKPFACTQCDHKVSDLSTLKGHIIKIHGVEFLSEIKYPQGVYKKFNCALCDFSAFREPALRKHLTSRHSDKIYQCEKCPYKTHDSNLLEIHVSTGVHIQKPTPRIYSCPMCNYKSAELWHLKVHLARNPHRTKYSCNLCLFDTDDKTVLMSHLKLHPGVSGDLDDCKTEKTDDTYLEADDDESIEEPLPPPKTIYACMLCDFCGDKQQLKSHFMKNHLNVNPYICLVCGFRTKTGVDLNSHILSHSEKKTYYCDMCNYKTNNKDDFDAHKKAYYEQMELYGENDKASKSENGSEKFHSCSSCDFKTKYPYNLIRHLSLKHNIISSLSDLSSL